MEERVRTIVEILLISECCMRYIYSVKYIFCQERPKVTSHHQRLGDNSKGTHFMF